MTNLVEKQPWFLSAELLTGILAGLEKIAEETSSGIRGNDEDGVIDIRASAASLAFALFEYYQRVESETPKAIRRWQEICHDPDEFSDVMNSWRDFTDDLLSLE